eukprot:411531_1
MKQGAIISCDGTDGRNKNYQSRWLINRYSKDGPDRFGEGGPDGYSGWISCRGDKGWSDDFRFVERYADNGRIKIHYLNENYCSISQKQKRVCIRYDDYYDQGK